MTFTPNINTPPDQSSPWPRSRQRPHRYPPRRGRVPHFFFTLTPVQLTRSLTPSLQPPSSRFPLCTSILLFSLQLLPSHHFLSPHMKNERRGRASKLRRYDVSCTLILFTGMSGGIVYLAASTDRFWLLCFA